MMGWNEPCLRTQKCKFTLFFLKNENKKLISLLVVFNTNGGMQHFENIQMKILWSFKFVPVRYWHQ